MQQARNCSPQRRSADDSFSFETAETASRLGTVEVRPDLG